jgi:hypothetical protein
MLLLALAWTCTLTAQVVSPYEIVQRSVDRDTSNYARLKDYTFHEFNTEKQLDKAGKVTHTDTELSEILMLGGRPYSRLLERGGKRLSEKEAQKEQANLDKEAAKRGKETDRDRAKFEKERIEGRKFAQEVPAAFMFQLLAEETIDGLPVWKIGAEPKPGFKPRYKDAGVFKKVRGTIWIEKGGYQWVRAEIEVIDTISWGFFVLRIPAGAKISFLQMRVNDEVWMPKTIHVRADAKLAMLKTFRMDMDVAFSDYRKFRAESQIIDAQELPQN